MTQSIKAPRNPLTRFSSCTKMTPEQIGFPVIPQEWSNQLRYSKGHPVMHGGKTYISTHDRNVRNVPSLESKHWSYEPKEIPR